MTITMHLRRFPTEGQLRKTYCGRQTSTKLASTNNVLRVTCKVCLREAREHEEQDKTRSKAAVWLQQRQILEILADDPGFEKDLPSWCKMSGAKFLGIEKEGNILNGYVIKPLQHELEESM